MNTRVVSRVPSALATLAAGVTAAAALSLALLSLRWPLVHDLPIFLYDGFLMTDLGRMPYRDFFEINAPGTLLLFATVHQLTGGEALALRLLDLSVLGAISALTLLTLRPHGLKAGVLAASCFAIVYLAEGPVQTLQREYLSVLPLVISTAVVLGAGPPRSHPMALFVAGLCAGAVMTLKPLLILCWVPLVAAAMGSRIAATASPRTPLVFAGAAARVLVPFAAGVAVVPILLVVWLARQEALDAYLDIVRNYYPLYAELNGNGTTWQGTPVERIQRYVGRPLELITRFRFAVPAFLGLLLAWRYRDRPAFVHCLVFGGIVVGGVIYVSLAGKFWLYHQFPLFYGLALLAGVSLTRQLSQPPGDAIWHTAIVGAALAVALPLQTIGREVVDWRAGRPFVVKEGRVDLVADYLREHVGRAESVTALDVTSGALHALYRDRRPLHGRVIYDHVFYHHADHPYIQRLRRELIAYFEADPPDVVVRADDTWLRTPDFPELETVLRDRYDLAFHGREMSILRLKPVARAPQSR